MCLLLAAGGAGGGGGCGACSVGGGAGSGGGGRGKVTKVRIFSTKKPTPKHLNDVTFISHVRKSSLLLNTKIMKKALSPPFGAINLRDKTSYL